MEFQGTDFFNLDDELTDEERLIRREIRKWVSERAIPKMAEHFEAGRFPLHLIPDMASFNMLGAALDPKYGGAGLGAVASGLISQELERGD
ncbi:MAG TPA: acyl-CoA dehydrogenase family protein, partial [Nitrospiria bacterium]|nr:acyl-CoA dehydrogenase family protein [Nitrospiria bacterium]